MGDITDITDDQWDRVENARANLVYAAKGGVPTRDAIDALDAVLFLRPVPVRPWQPGDWCESGMVVLVDAEDGEMVTVGWDRTGWEPHAHWRSFIDAYMIDPPDSWVAAGRPGAVPDQPNPMDVDIDPPPGFIERSKDRLGTPSRDSAPVGEATEDLSDGSTDYTDPRTIDVDVVRANVDHEFTARGHRWTDRPSWPNVTVKALADRITQLESRPVGEEATIEPDWEDIAAAIDHGFGRRSKSQFTLQNDDFTGAVAEVVGPLLAAPAGTPSDWWYCTMHANSAVFEENHPRWCRQFKSPSGVPMDHCVWVELLVPATTDLADEGSDQDG